MNYLKIFLHQVDLMKDLRLVEYELECEKKVIEVMKHKEQLLKEQLRKHENQIRKQELEISELKNERRKNNRRHF